MKIGNARYCLTPKNEFYLIGYRSDNRYYPAKGVHDDIYCNSLLLSGERKELFIFSADFLEFEEEMAEEVKSMMQETFGLDRDLILLCATHNHSSVVSYHKRWYTGKFNQEYYDFLIQVIRESYKTCKENAREATAKYGKEIIRGYYGNRNHPGELADNEVIVVKFYDEQEKPFAGLVNWAVHSTVLGAENEWLTSDLAGEVSKNLFKSFGFYPAMIVGAAGDCSNRNERRGKDFQELERVAFALAVDIAKINAETKVAFGDIRCQTLFHTIHHDRKEGENFHLDVKCSVIAIGEIQIFVFPGELGSAFGIILKEMHPSVGIVSGYTNGYYGYFMPKEEYELSFETKESPIPKGEPERLIEKFVQASKLLNLE